MHLLSYYCVIFNFSPWIGSNVYTHTKPTFEGISDILKMIEYKYVLNKINHHEGKHHTCHTTS
jgi:hypothetical protein